MKTYARLLLCLGIATPIVALAQGSTPEFSGNARVYAEDVTLSNRGPLERATSLLSTIAKPDTANLQFDITLKSTWAQWAGSVTFRGADSNASDGSARLVLDELTRSHDFGKIHGVAGKKVVSWDVGYAFRPNDLVQQEARRPLVQRTLEGRPLAMIEGFAQDSAWSVLAFYKESRPQDADPFAKTENMLAGRYYQRLGSADLYGFAGWGSESRGTAGAAFSWVLSDSIEWHGSYRRTGRHKVRSLPVTAAIFAKVSPYVEAIEGGNNQALIGMTWTNEDKFGVIAEAWYDGNAPPNGFWKDWQNRGKSIETALASNRAGQGALNEAAAGNLGWQANQLRAGSLRRTNLFVRASWSYEQLEPTLDLLYTPVDHGLIVTAALAWKGDRVRVEGGARFFGGAKNSLSAQMPFRSLVYLGAIVPF